MDLKLKPEQERLLERLAGSGLDSEEVLDQAFAIIQQQHENLGWMLEEREAIAAHIAEGFAQAQRGELINPEEAIRMLEDRRTKRHIA